MGEKSDLRTAKTVRSIKSAFLELISKKPLGKITVTELAARAEISKGTFYLHYLDLFDLYNRLVEETADKIAGSFNPYPELFSDPASFVRTFLFAQVAPLGADLSPGERALLSEKNVPFCPQYPQCFLNAFKRRIYGTGQLTRCEENDIKLDFLLTGMLSVLIQHGAAVGGSPEQRDRTVSFLSDVIRDAFPALCRGTGSGAD